VTELADLEPGAQYTVQVRARGVDGRLSNFSDAVTVADTDPVIPGTINTWSFLPHDAILSWVLAVAVRLSVCPSEAGVVSKWLDGSISYLAYFHLSYTVAR